MASVYRMAVDPDATNNPHSYALQLTGTAGRVLELGCSDGYVTEHLVARGNTVVGIEIDADAAEAAREFAQRVHVIDLDTTPASSVEDGPFDVVIAGDVLEHLRDPDATLADLVTLLAPGGRIVISIPNVSHVDLRLLLLEGRWTYQDTGLLDRTHLRFFTRQSLRDLLAGAGLVARRVERVHIDPFTSGLPVDRGVHGADVLAFVAADPEARTFQFVVEAVHAAPDVADALADDGAVDWPRLEHADEAAALRRRVDELETHNAALTAEVEAWQNSKLVRLAAPARSLWAKVRGLP